MRRPFPHAAALVVVLAMSACTGTGSADPTTPPSASSSASSPSTPTTPETPLPTATPSPTATATPDPTPPATPSPTFTGGIDPPTEAPEGFSEFSVPPPQDLTEDYAAWVLAEIYRAEDELIRRAVNAPDQKLDSLPQDFVIALESTYDGNILEISRDNVLATIEQPSAEEPFKPDPGATKLSNVELLDASQDCLVVKFVGDPEAILRDPMPPRQYMTLLVPKPEIEASNANRTPWLMVERAPTQDVTGSGCPS